MAGTSKSTIAGILDIIAGVAGLIGGVPLAIMGVVGYGILGTVARPELHILAPMALALFGTLAVMLFIAGVIAIVGGVAASKRRRWGRAVAGSIAAVFGFFPVGIVAVVFTILAEPEFHAAD